MSELLNHIHYIKKGREALPAIAHGGDAWQASWAERDKALAKLEAVITRDLPKVKIDKRFDGCRVSIAGIRASSTSGLDGALANWVNAAYRQLDKVNGHTRKENEL